MIIIEKPYVSELLIDTIVQHDLPVLDTESVAEAELEEGALNLISSEDAKNYYLSQEYPLIYSNSERAITWVLDNLPKSNLAGYINLFKDKAAFREMLSELYPDFYYKALTLDELKSMKPADIKFPIVLKPSIGYLSMGVHTIYDQKEWKDVIEKIDKEITQSSEMFSNSVINSSKFLIEEHIDGEEYAIDAYYDRNGEPVILNIFQHPFLNSKDVSNRIYLTSTGIMIKYMSKFAILLRQIGQKANLRNFPIHIELRVTQENQYIPIEINPMRFAGWCTTDIAKYAWNINVYEHFYYQKRPDWNNILMNAGKEVYYYSMAEVPAGTDKQRIKEFDYDKFLANYSNILEVRKINYKENPLFAIIFGSTVDKQEVVRILSLKTSDYIK